MNKFLQLFAATCLMLVPFILHADPDVEKHQKFTLQEFNGNFITYGYTVGGEGQVAQSFIAQTHSKNGKGTINFFSASAFIPGTPTGSILSIPDSADPVSFTLELVSEKHGTGTITIPIPADLAAIIGVDEIVAEFVASRKDGRVEELFLNIVSPASPSLGLVQTISIRQH